MEKYEIIIKDNGEEIRRVSVKGFLLTAVYEDGIFGLCEGDRVSSLDITLMTNANEELVDQMWAKYGVTSRKEREKICGLARRVEMAVEKGDEK